MKARFVGVRDLKTHLSAFLDQKKPLVVTDRGKPKHFVIPYNEMLEIIDILEEASDPRLVANVERARAEYKRTGGIPMDLIKFKKEIR